FASAASPSNVGDDHLSILSVGGPGHELLSNCSAPTSNIVPLRSRTKKANEPERSSEIDTLRWNSTGGPICEQRGLFRFEHLRPRCRGTVPLIDSSYEH